MSLLFRSPERRAVTVPWDYTWESAEPVAHGQVPALRLIPLYAATRLIADQLASAPLRAYRPLAGGGREALPSQPSLLQRPTPWQFPYSWKYAAVTSLLLWGNAYGLILERDSRGWPVTIVWLPPDRVQVDGDALGPPSYEFAGTPVPGDMMLHIAGYSLPGRVEGVSPLGHFRQTVETGRAAEKYARDWYRGGGIPSAVVRNETQTLDAEQARKVKARLMATLRNGEPFVTGKDWTYDSVGVPAADARFIETAKLTATQIAAIYGVPAEEIGGESGSSLTYSTQELNAIKLSVQTVRPWAVRLEEAIASLFRGQMYLKFNLDAGVRADLLTRYRAHEIGTRIGLETNDEARALEERPPLSDDEKADWMAMYPGRGTTRVEVGGDA